MGIERAALYSIGGYLADQLFNTGGLLTIGAGLWGGLMSPDSGEVSAKYDKRRATLNDMCRKYGGFEMPEGLFGSGKKPADLKPDAARAAAEAERRDKEQKPGGFKWGGLLATAGALFFGKSLLDRVTMGGGFSNGLFAPFVDPYQMQMQQQMGMPGMHPGIGLSNGIGNIMSILPLAALALIGIKRFALPV